MKIVIPGGSGQVGSVLARAFEGDGHEVIVLSRRPLRARWRIERWDGDTLGPWARALEGADAVINLAGRSVNCRYTAANRREILESRVRSTRVVGEAIAQCSHPPRVWLQASTATIYAHRYDAANDEWTGSLGGGAPGAPESWDFSIAVARAWEEALRTAPGATRKVALRSAVTMSPDAGGPFDVLLGLVRRGLGGTTGDGRQFVSWVHHEDFVRAVVWLIDREDIDGAVNIASPEPLPNAEFMRVLRTAWGVPFGMPTRGWLLDLGAAMMRTETELVLKSRRVVPARLIESGFQFRYGHWSDAARDLVSSWRIGSVSTPCNNFRRAC